MFYDRVKIRCKAGNGGEGCVSFLREKFAPNGGPDGGDGGNGGNIVFKTSPNVTNLADFRYTCVFKAKNGEPGGKRNKTGKSAPDTIINVPVGTVIKNAETDKVVADLNEKDMEIVLLHGGVGGKGNTRYATPTRQAPRFSGKGGITQEYELILELKTIADVGLIGYPNVGKSSLLATISNAKPKIANYHFTTLAPNVGVVKAYDSTFVMADIPGLIEGASDGAGLGHYFLRHIERTRLLVHVIDISGSEGRDPYEDYLTINKELEKYSEKVYNTPQIIALNKSDLVVDEAIIEDFKSKVKDKPIYVISAAAYMGIDPLLKEVVDTLKTIPVPESIAIEETLKDMANIKEYSVVETDPGYFEVSGPLIDSIAFGVVLDEVASMAYFQKRLKDEGIIDKLKSMGMVEGDTVRMCNLEFEYTE